MQIRSPVIILAIAAIMMTNSVLALLQSAVTISSSGTVNAEVLDQSQEVQAGYYAVYDNSPAGQEFMPNNSLLTATGLLLNITEDGTNETVTVNVRQGTINGVVVVTASQRLLQNSGWSDWVHFSFSIVPTVTVNATYVIELIVEDSKIGWSSSISTNPYDRGDAIRDGSVQSNEDWCFKTYHG